MKDYSRFNLFKVEKDHKVVIVTINHPETNNTFDKLLHGQAAEIFLELSTENDMEAIVLTGAGKTFSLGGILS